MRVKCSNKCSLQKGGRRVSFKRLSSPYLHSFKRSTFQHLSLLHLSCIPSPINDILVSARAHRLREHLLLTGTDRQGEQREVAARAVNTCLSFPLPHFCLPHHAPRGRRLRGSSGSTPKSRIPGGLGVRPLLTPSAPAAACYHAACQADLVEPSKQGPQAMPALTWLWWRWPQCRACCVFLFHISAFRTLTSSSPEGLSLFPTSLSGWLSLPPPALGLL